MKASEVTALLDDLLAGTGSADERAARLGAVRVEDLDGEGLAAGVDYLRSRAIAVPGCADAIDIVGTGGGRFRQVGALNISTLSSLLCASAGVAVCKHGNRKASSTSGSADVLEALGFPIGLGPNEVLRCVQETRFGYCFAPRFHPGLAALAPIRRQLGRPTMINWFAPLANPARPRYFLLGTHNPQLARLIANALLPLGVQRATVVCGPDGLDELSVVSPSLVISVDAATGDVRERTLVPAEEFRMRFDAEPVGGDTAWNLKLAQQALGGTSESPYRETLQANVALALYTRGVHGALRDAFAAAGAVLAASASEWFERARSFHRGLAPAP
jgi:anthranilate phosphoribosyltransferase